MNLELNAVHALIFVVAASLMLFVLFFFNLYKVVRVIYGLGGSAAMSQIIFHPVYHWASSKNDSFSKKFHSIAFGDLPGMRGVYFKWIEIASFVSSYGMGIAWIYLGLNLIDPLSNHYYWVVQDIMGVCYCILILGLVHINTLMVATILLVLIFFYDIFYVFLTPYIFGSSVMIDVATGGGGSVDADFCEKYPSDSACRGYKAPLPMMLAVPWISGKILALS